MYSRMKRTAHPPHLPLLLALLALSCPHVKAQAPPEAGRDKALIQQLLSRINQLEASQKQMQEKLEKLATRTQEAAPATTPTPAPASAVAAETPPPVEEPTTQEPEAHVLGPIQFNGFADFNYGRPPTSTLPPGTGLVGSTNSFNIGDFDLFVNSRISERWSVVGEMLVSSDFGNDFNVEMDRLLVTYKPSPYFQIGIGKFNTALGYYSNGFHRARYFQYATGRPMMYSDEDDGGILPVHSVGVTTTGKIPSGAIGLHWVAEVANGRTMNNGENEIQNFVDENNGKAFNLAVYAKPERLHGFQTGFSVYRDKVHIINFAPAIGETILTGHVVYNAEKFEWLNEASVIRDDLLGKSILFRSITSYSELSYLFGKARPYFRYEYQNVPNGDPVFGLLGPFASFTAGRRNGPSLGIGYHVTNYAVFKLQYGWLGERGLPSTYDFGAQIAVAF